MHSKQHISLIPELLKKKGVRQVVISPGSRNAPLIKIFYETFGNDCISIVDERSAGYFALGLALRSQIPVVLISTSGTAVLNYGPALAEAYHQGVSLIAITADRPTEWINQQDNQTIKQNNIFSNNIKFSCELPVVSTTSDDVWYANRLINEVFNISVSGKPGPVHVNVPLREPLYEELPKVVNLRDIKIASSIGASLSSEIINTWQNTSRILIVCGQLTPDAELSALVNYLTTSGKVVVLAETISNISGIDIIKSPDLLLVSRGNETDDLLPELVVYFGGQVISKRLKSFLRNLKNTEFWFVDASAGHIDTFKNLTTIIPVAPKLFFSEVLKISANSVDDSFSRNWLKADQVLREKIDTISSIIEYSDLQVFKLLSKLISPGDSVFAGNSSVIRYIQMFDLKAKFVYSNRGTSGIDGCLSTACGIAHNSDEPVYAILGDLSFIYDSNGLWNKNLPKNLKIIVINNSGGGIFSLLEGPASQEFFSEYLNANHPVDISKLCSAFGIKHFECNEVTIHTNIFEAFKSQSSAVLMEIKTPAEKNPEIFRNFIKNISNQN